jgi:hypothetical protein
MRTKTVSEIGWVALCLLALAGLLLLPVGAAILSFCNGPSFAGGRAVEKPFHQVVSPDGRYVAVSFMGGGGATTGLSYHVNLRESRRPFRETRQGWIEEGQVYHAWGGNAPAERLVWEDSTHLTI